tara:strand:+ start:4092 stop:4301 length:210 start_codon:yes stop_codon:yes gene_type:complete
MFSKVEVNGEGACPLYNVLTAAIANPDGKPDVMWNFTKFLVDREGSVVERFEPGVSPEQIAETLPSYLD